MAVFVVGLVQHVHEGLLFPALFPARLQEGELAVVLRHELKKHDPDFLVPEPLAIDTPQDAQSLGVQDQRVQSGHGRRLAPAAGVLRIGVEAAGLDETLRPRPAALLVEFARKTTPQFVFIAQLFAIKILSSCTPFKEHL